MHGSDATASRRHRRDLSGQRATECFRSIASPAYTSWSAARAQPQPQRHGIDDYHEPSTPQLRRAARMYCTVAWVALRVATHVYMYVRNAASSAVHLMLCASASTSLETNDRDSTDVPACLLALRSRLWHRPLILGAETSSLHPRLLQHAKSLCHWPPFSVLCEHCAKGR